MTTDKVYLEQAYWMRIIENMYEDNDVATLRQRVMELSINKAIKASSNSRNMKENTAPKTHSQTRSKSKSNGNEKKVFFSEFEKLVLDF